MTRAGDAGSGLTIVMPVLDEAQRLPQRLRELMATPGIDELLVVDGGSRDGTRELAASFADELAARGTHLRVMQAASGRGQQLNAGAAQAAGRVLLFQHADVALPADTRALVEGVLSRPGTVAGAFWTWHVDDSTDARHVPWLHLADLRSSYTRLPYGDQCLFVLRAEFQAVGGFPDIPLMEDLELARRLCRRGRIGRVPASVRVSGRRFLHAPVRAALMVHSFPWLYRLGVSPARLRSWYTNVR